MERNVLHAEMRPVLLNLSDYKTLSLNVVKRLLYLTRLSPNTFNEKFCDQILVCHIHLMIIDDSIFIGAFEEVGRQRTSATINDKDNRRDKGMRDCTRNSTRNTGRIGPVHRRRHSDDYES